MVQHTCPPTTPTAPTNHGIWHASRTDNGGRICNYQVQVQIQSFTKGASWKGILMNTAECTQCHGKKTGYSGAMVHRLTLHRQGDAARNHAMRWSSLVWRVQHAWHNIHGAAVLQLQSCSKSGMSGFHMRWSMHEYVAVVMVQIKQIT